MTSTLAVSPFPPLVSSRVAPGVVAYDADSPLVVEFSTIGINNPAFNGSKLFRAFALTALDEATFEDVLPLLNGVSHLGLTDKQLKDFFVLFLGGCRDQIAELDCKLLSDLHEGLGSIQDLIAEQIDNSNASINEQHPTVAASLLEFMSIVAPARPVSDIHQTDYESFLEKEFDSDELTDSDTEEVFVELVRKVLDAYGFYSDGRGNQQYESEHARWSCTNVPEAVKNVVWWQSFNDDEYATDAVHDVKAAISATMQQINLQDMRDELVELREGTSTYVQYAEKILAHFGAVVTENAGVIWESECCHPALEKLANSVAQQQKSANESESNSTEVDLTLLVDTLPFALQAQRVVKQLKAEVDFEKQLLKQQAQKEDRAFKIEDALEAAKILADRQMSELLKNLENYKINRRYFKVLRQGIREVLPVYENVSSSLKDRFINALIDQRFNEKNYIFKKEDFIVECLKQFAIKDFQAALQNLDNQPIFLANAGRYRSAILATESYLHMQQAAQLSGFKDPRISNMLKLVGGYEENQTSMRLLVEANRQHLKEAAIPDTRAEVIKHFSPAFELANGFKIINVVKYGDAENPLLQLAGKYPDNRDFSFLWDTRKKIALISELDKNSFYPGDPTSNSIHNEIDAII